jgi:hypothetical protein
MKSSNNSSLAIQQQVVPDIFDLWIAQRNFICVWSGNWIGWSEL